MTGEELTKFAAKVVICLMTGTFVLLAGYIIVDTALDPAEWRRMRNSADTSRQRPAQDLSRWVSGPDGRPRTKPLSQSEANLLEWGFGFVVGALIAWGLYWIIRSAVRDAQPRPPAPPPVEVRKLPVQHGRTRPPAQRT